MSLVFLFDWAVPVVMSAWVNFFCFLVLCIYFLLIFFLWNVSNEKKGGLITGWCTFSDTFWNTCRITMCFTVWGAQCPSPCMLTFCNRRRLTKEARLRRRTKRRRLWTSLHRLRVNTRLSLSPNTIVSDTIRKLSVSFSHRLRVNGA